MSDEVDAANELLQKMIDAGISKAQGTINVVNTTGKCIWCGEEVHDERRWCSAECRNDYERFNNG